MKSLLSYAVRLFFFNTVEKLTLKTPEISQKAMQGPLKLRHEQESVESSD